MVVEIGSHHTYKRQVLSHGNAFLLGSCVLLHPCSTLSTSSDRLRQPPLLKGHQLMTSWGKITQHIPNINTLDGGGGAIKLLSAATKATFFPVFAFIKMFHIKWLTATDIKFIPWKIKAVAHREKINMQWWIITWMNLSAGNVNDMQSLNCLCVIM